MSLLSASPETTKRRFRPRTTYAVWGEAAPGTPFDHAIFEIGVEPLDAPLPERPWDPESPLAEPLSTPEMQP